MSNIRKLFILLNLVIFSSNLIAQNAGAVPGINGIFVKLGTQIPKDFKYLLERRTADSKENWQIIYSSNLPKNLNSLKYLLFRINIKNPFYQQPDSAKITYFFNKLNRYNSSDSISFYNGSLLFLEAMGTGYFDTQVEKDTKYQYKVTKIGTDNQRFDIQITKTVSFPGKEPEYSIEHHKTIVQGSKINLYYYLKGDHKPFGFKVFRQYTLQSPFREIEPITKYFYKNDSLFLYISDIEVAEKLIYRYFVQPHDLLGNKAANSDTIQVSNVKEYSETPLLSTFKSVSLDTKNAIKLSWRFPNTDNLRGISLYRSERFDSGYKRMVDIPASDTTYIDSRVEPVKTYYYYLIIHGAYGDSPPTSKVAGMLKNSLTLVTPPQSISIRKVKEGNKISWQRVERGTIGYYIYRGEGYRPEIKQYTDIIRSDSANVSFIDSLVNLREGQAYSYAVVAVNLSNSKSPLSKIVVADPIKPNLPTPLNLQVFQNPNGALLMWEDMAKISSYVCGYKVFRSVYDEQGKLLEVSKIVNSGKETAGNNSYLDTTFRRGFKYTYAVKAVGIENSESGKSYEVSFYLPKIMPHPPSGLRAFTTHEGVVIQWDTPLAEEIKSYKIYREELGRKTKLLAEVNPKVTNYEDKLPQKLKDYFYTISVVSSDGIESNKSEEVGVKY